MVRDGYKMTELGELPEDWDIKPIKEIVQNKKGAIKIGPFGSQLKLEDMVSKGIKVYGQENVIKKDLRLGNRYISNAKYESLKTCTIFPNDLVMTMMGTIGKCIVFPDEFEMGVMDSHLLRIQPDDALANTSYLIHVLEKYDRVEGQIKRKSQGGIMSGLSSTIIKDIQIPLPPLPEQKRIAEFLSAADKRIEKEESYRNKLLQIKKGLMQDLLTGRVRVTV